MASRGLIRNLARDRILAAVAVIVVAILGVLVWRGWGERTFRLRFSAGSARGLRHAMAETLVAGGRNRRLLLTLQPSSGSEEALDRIESGQIDLALVQGSLDPGPRKNVRQVAALHVEPLHLLVKEELANDVSRALDALRGRSINLGEAGSGTRALSTEVLRFAGLEPGADYRDESQSYERMESEPSRDNLPDAVFMVSLLPSRVAKHLVTRRGYRLVEMRFAEAFSLASDSETADLATQTGRVARDHVLETVIPAFTYGVRPAVPPEPLRTLGTRLLLVAHRDVDPEAVATLLDISYNTSFAQLAHPPLSLRLLDIPTEFPPHAGLLLFQERSKPLFTGDVIDAIEKELSIAGAVLGAAFFFWQWLKGRTRRMRESGFEHYILRVAEIEDRALRIELGQSLDLGGLLSLQDSLGQVRGEAIAKFASGELEGEDLLTGFLAQVSNARDHLTRLILHRRDDLEDQAREENRDARLLWREALNDSPIPQTPAEETGPTYQTAEPTPAELLTEKR